MTKLLIFGLIHVCIAFSLSYLLTGSVAIAGVITFVEPLANTVALWALEKLWHSHKAPPPADTTGIQAS